MLDDMHYILHLPIDECFLLIGKTGESTITYSLREVVEQRETKPSDMSRLFQGNYTALLLLAPAHNRLTRSSPSY
jgi:hypothetical protein